MVEALFQQLDFHLLVVNGSGEVVAITAAAQSIPQLDGVNRLQDLTGASVASWDKYATTSIISGSPEVIPDLLGDPKFSSRISPLDDNYFLIQLTKQTTHQEQTVNSQDLTVQGVSSQLVIEALNYQKKYLSEQKRSHTDQLTGIPNRRQFEENLSEALAAFDESETLFSLMILDIDFFKKINDTYGHAKGDEVLVEFGNLLLTQLMNVGLPHRVGGEEFAVILRGYGSEEAMKAAEILRQKIQEARLGGIDVTSSIGVGTFDHSAWNRSLLLEGTDDALYEAKRTGRNRVVHVSQLAGFQTMNCA